MLPVNLVIENFQKSQFFGRVQLVKHNEDFKIQIVKCFEDFKVVIVQHMIDENGKWFFVNHNPDFKIKLVSHNPDLKIRISKSDIREVNKKFQI